MGGGGGRRGGVANMKINLGDILWGNVELFSLDIWEKWVRKLGFLTRERQLATIGEERRHVIDFKSGQKKGREMDFVLST